MLPLLVVFLAAAVVAVTVFRRLGLGTVLGYLAAGVVVGPSVLGFAKDVEATLHFAELGVVLLLFLIGLELQPSRLWKMRGAVFGVGTVQVVATGTIVGGLAFALGATPAEAGIVGAALALSSTAFAMQTLAEKNELTRPHGRAAFGILLFQDVATIPLLAVVPLLSDAESSHDGENVWLQTGLVAGVIVGLVLAGRFLLRPLLRFVAQARSHELSTASTLLVVCGTALLMEHIEISMALGAFLAGVLLADSEFRHELEANIEPFKGLLLGLFFMAVGMSADLSVLFASPIVVLALALALVALKIAILYGIGRWQKLTNRESASLAIAISQGGEFAFVIFGVAVDSTVMRPEVRDLLVLMVTLSMVTTYDPATGQVDTVSMPTRDGDASVTIDLDFDGPLLTRQAWSGVVNGAVAFDYDERWQLDFVQVGASAPIEYAFDRDGLVTRAGPMTITRDPIRGLPVATTVGRVTTELVVDAFGAPERRAASWPGGGFSTEVTDFDPAGRIEEIVETDGGTATTYRYEYDDAGRLETVRRNGREIATYDYDLRGNRDAWSDERGAMSATFDAQDRLGSTSGALARSYVHDGHGRVTSWTDSTGTTRLEVDELGNLLGVELPDGTEITYEVDALGRRVARAVDGVRTHAWLYQGDRPIAELDPDGDVRAVFVYASHALAPELMLADGRTYRLVHDHLGSIRRVVDTATGEVVQALDFDAYGRVLRDTNPGFQPFGYAAGHYDPQTGLVRYGARDYDAAIGRWLAKDPILIAGGDTNLYAYVTGDPVNFVDPDGHNPLFWGLMVGLATGAASDQGNDGESDPVAVFGGVVLGGAFKAASVGVSFLWRGLRPCPAPPPANAAATTGASSGASQTSTVLLRTSRNLQKFFGKHGADFGLSGKWNPSRAADASRAIHQHINNPGVRSIQGSYRGNPATHYLDPNTGLNVVADSAGNFVTGYRLGSGQLTDLLATGHLF